MTIRNHMLLSSASLAPIVRVLPEAPVGDVFDDADEEGDADFDPELGDTEIGYEEEGDFEEGAPKRKTLTAAQLARKIARGTATSAEKRAYAALKRGKPAVAKYVRQASTAQRLSTGALPNFEHFKGARLITSSLGAGAKLDPAEVVALKAFIHASPPFEPIQVSVPTDTIDLQEALFNIMGEQPFYLTGVIVTLAASTLSINQGAVVTITRRFGGTSSAPIRIVDNVELVSGVSAVEMLLLNGTLVSGKPRFWAPLITPSAIPDPPGDRPYTITFGGVPSGYVKSVRFLQPGDSQVDNFLKLI